jgi:Na+-driven multidrug efflux pump
LDGILIGAGDQRHMAKAMASAAGIGIPAIILTRVAGLGIGWVWGGIWIFMLARTSLLYRRFLSGRWQVTGA